MKLFSKGLISETGGHTFNLRKQEEGEPFDDFVRDIKILSKKRNYCKQQYPGNLRDQIVAGVTSPGHTLIL